VTHPLKSYLRETETTEADFAKKLGTTSSYVSQIVCAQRWPSRSLADAIEQATGGLVKAADLLTWKPERAA
jgi:DNA-binding transcriptional regulator YdaS (Cro superfamily)